MKRANVNLGKGPYLHLLFRGSRTVTVSWGHHYISLEGERIYRSIFEALNVNAWLGELWRLHHDALPEKSSLTTTGGYGGVWRRCPHRLARRVKKIIEQAHREIVATVADLPPHVRRESVQ